MSDYNPWLILWVGLPAFLIALALTSIPFDALVGRVIARRDAGVDIRKGGAR